MASKVSKENLIFEYSSEERKNMYNVKYSSREKKHDRLWDSGSKLEATLTVQVTLGSVWIYFSLSRGAGVASDI